MQLIGQNYVSCAILTDLKNIFHKMLMSWKYANLFWGSVTPHYTICDKFVETLFAGILGFIGHIFRIDGIHIFSFFVIDFFFTSFSCIFSVYHFTFSAEHWLLVVHNAVSPWCEVFTSCEVVANTGTAFPFLHYVIWRVNF